MPARDEGRWVPWSSFVITKTRLGLRPLKVYAVGNTFEIRRGPCASDSFYDSPRRGPTMNDEFSDFLDEAVRSAIERAQAVELREDIARH